METKLIFNHGASQFTIILLFTQGVECPEAAEKHFAGFPTSTKEFLTQGIAFSHPAVKQDRGIVSMH